MTHALSRIVAFVFAGTLAASCTGLVDHSSGPGSDGGSGDGTTSCGSLGEPCCNGAACDNWFTCSGGMCSGLGRGSGSSGGDAAPGDALDDADANSPTAVPESAPPSDPSASLGDASPDLPTGDSGAPPRVTGTCDQTEQGLLNQFSSVAEVNDMIVGRWLHCSGGFLSLTTDEVGIEFDQDGSWYTLVQVDSGPLVRGGASLTHQGTWDVSNEGTTASGTVAVQFNIHYAQGGNGCQPAFSLTPTKFTCGLDNGSPLPDLYVAIP